MINGMFVDILSLSSGRKRIVSMCTLIIFQAVKMTLHPGKEVLPCTRSTVNCCRASARSLAWHSLGAVIVSPSAPQIVVSRGPHGHQWRLCTTTLPPLNCCTALDHPSRQITGRLPTPSRGPSGPPWTT